MTKIVLSTHNMHKAREFAAWFDEIMPGKFEVVTSASLGLPDPVEDGETFEDNAYIKAKAALDATGCISIADDSGLCVDALDGAPGVYSARFAGEGGSYEDCINKLLGLMENVPDEKRGAGFVCCICMLFPDGKKLEAKGVVRGEILRGKRGDNKFGYDPVFYYPPFGLTFAEADMAMKNKVSHRGNALSALREKLLGAIDIEF